MADRIAIIGGGTMGRGIAQVCAISGYEAVLVDLDRKVLDSARETIEASVEKGIARGKTSEDARDRITSLLRFEVELPEALSGATWVIEAVPEDVSLKQQVLRSSESHVDEAAILATNTSSLSVTTIGEVLSHPARMIGMHFFNPVPVMGLVEVVRSKETSEEVVDRTLKLARDLGKEPIVVEDTPGFATSRLGVVLGLEAIRMLESGVAAAEDIDKAMELGYRHPMGPLRLTDLIGLDVRLAIAEYLHRHLGEQFRPPLLLKEMVEKGHIGRKTGQGFYSW